MKTLSRWVALAVIAAITLTATAVAFAQSYEGLKGWASHHLLTGGWAVIWPLQVDAFILVGELALYVAVVERWPVRRHVLGWVVTSLGGIVSILGNVGHVGGAHDWQTYATAAVPPLAATAGLAVGLQVLKWVLHLVATPVPPVPVRIVTAAPGTAWRLAPVAWHMAQVPGMNRPPADRPAVPARRLDAVKLPIPAPAAPVQYANGLNLEPARVAAPRPPAATPRPATDGRDFTRHARWDEAVEAYAASGHTMSSRSLAAALGMSNRSLATAVINHHKNGD